MAPLQRRKLGASGIEVSELSLGSWRTNGSYPVLDTVSASDIAKLHS